MSKSVCAHRGASLELPDNSMEAFVAAIAAGADFIETDVRMAPDGRLVLAHDPWDIVDGVVDLSALVDLARGLVGLDLEIVDVGLERALLDVVDGFTGPLIVTSTEIGVLDEVRRLTAHVETGLVVEAHTPGDPFALAGPHTLLVEDELATPELLARGPLWVWTVNDPSRLGALLGEANVLGVITDDPALAVRLRAG